MEPKNEERRLTTILSADVVGYSRLMAKDEAGTLAQLRAHRKELIEPKTAEYRGRVVKLMGDGTLMEFGSVVDAVLFAVEVQRAMAARNADIPPDHRILYRIGINIGDIIVVGDDIYGDGVNVATRLQSLAEPGGICVARNVYSQVRNKVEFGFNDLGEQALKNMPEPVSTYKVWWGDKPIEETSVEAPAKSRSLRWPIAASIAAFVAIGGIAYWTLFARDSTPAVEAASLERMAYPLPEKPSIAVPVFMAAQTDRSDQLLATGLADAVIAVLTHRSSLFVIGPQSSLRSEYRGSAPRRIAEQFGVRYVLMGSMSRNSEDIAIDARLIDVIDGRQLWRKTVEAGITDLYRLQTEIANHVRASLASDKESAGSSRGNAGMPSHAPHGESFAYLLQGIGHFRNATPVDIDKAGGLIAQAIGSDPDNALAHAWGAWNEVFGVMMGWSDSREERIQRAFTSARKAVLLDPSLAFARFALGATFMVTGDHRNAAAQFKRGLDLDPHEPNLLAGAAKSMAFQGAGDDAVEHGMRALRQNPNPPDWYYWNIGTANYFARHPEDAVALLERALSKNLEARLFLIGSYIRSERASDAALQADEVFQADPAFHIAGYIDRTTFANPDDKQTLVTDLLAAGLPENVSFTCMLEPSIENCR